MLLNKANNNNTKKIVRTTLGIGGLLVAVSMIYLIFLNGINQAYLLGTVGLFLVTHAAIILSKMREIPLPIMVSSYNITACFIFISWTGFFIYNGEISGAIILGILAILSGVASRYPKNKKR